MIGSFSPKTFSRIVNYANVWIGAAGFGPLEQLEQAINNLKEIARKADKDPSKVSIYIVNCPNILESPLPSSQVRTPMTGAVEQIGSDNNKLRQWVQITYYLVINFLL